MKKLICKFIFSTVVVMLCLVTSSCSQTPNVTKPSVKTSIQGLKLVARIFPHETTFSERRIVMPLTFSTDDRYAAFGISTVSINSSIKNWLSQIKILNLKTQKVVRSFSTGSHVASLAVFSPNNEILATGGEDNTIRLWNVSSGRIQKTLLGHKNAVVAIAFSPNGELLASGSRDSTVRYWIVKTGKLKRTFIAHKRTPYALTFSSNSKYLFSGSYEGLVAKWNLVTEQLAWKRKVNFSIDQLVYIDRKRVIRGLSIYDSVSEWSDKDGSLISHIKMLPKRGGLNQVAVSSNGRVAGRLLMGSRQKLYLSEVTLVDTSTGKPLSSLVSSDIIRSVVVSSKGNAILIHSLENGISLWSRQ